MVIQVHLGDAVRLCILMLRPQVVVAVGPSHFHWCHLDGVPHYHIAWVVGCHHHCQFHPVGGFLGRLRTVDCATKDSNDIAAFLFINKEVNVTKGFAAGGSHEQESREGLYRCGVTNLAFNWPAQTRYPSFFHS